MRAYAFLLAFLCACGSVSRSDPGDGGDSDAAPDDDPDGAPGGGGPDAGTPPACTEDSDCPDLTPECQAKECRSCDGGDCSPEQLLAEALAVVCQYAVEAGGNTATAFGPGYCAGTPEDSDELRRLLAALRAGRATSAVTRLRECGAATIPALRFEVCARRSAASRLPEHSNGVLAIAAVPETGLCRTDDDCITADCTMASACDGACVPRGPRNIPCTLDAGCQPGVFCNSSGNGLCLDDPPTMEGAACLFGDFCGDGLYCDPTDFCRPLRSEGDTCDNFAACGETLACPPETDVCQAYPTAGQPCAVVALVGANVCGDGHFCNTELDQCEVVRTEGQDCDAARRCAPGLSCEGGECTRVHLRNERCEAEDLCAPGLRCSAGRCAPGLPDLGQECASHCARGACVAGTCVATADDVDCALPVVGVGDSCSTTTSCVPTCIDCCDGDGECITTAPRCTGPPVQVCPTLE